MRKLFQLLALASLVAITLSAPIFRDQNDEDYVDDSDDDSQSFEVLDIDKLQRWKKNTATPNADPCPSRSMPCKAGLYLDPSLCRCRKCPNGMTSDYSPTKPFPNVGVNSCKTCKLPYRIFRCPAFLSKNCKSLKLCVYPGDRDFWMDVFETFKLPKFAVKMIPLMYPDVYVAPSFKFRQQLDAAKLRLHTDTLDDAQDAVAACDIDAVGCCLPGTFGPNANNCTECPNLHSSPYGTPSSDCRCLNTFAESCKPCNLCEDLDASNQCVSKCSLTPFSRCSLVDFFAKQQKRTIKAGTCY